MEWFIFCATILAFIHAFSIPVWQSFFQESSEKEDWKVIGASRKTLVSAAGGIGSLITGISLKSHDYSKIYILASGLCLLSTLFLAIHAQVNASTYRKETRIK